MITETQAREAFFRAKTRDQMDRLFRALSKRLHPDLSGDPGEAFIILKREYEAAIGALENEAERVPPKVVRPRDEAFDPFKLAREMGFERAMDARAHLYLALRRYTMVNLHLRKIRTSPGLAKRNELILATIGFWAERYDPGFLVPFRAWHEPPPRGIASSDYSRLERSATHWLQKGLEHFFLYQEDGRDSLRVLARGALEETRDLTRSYGLELEGPLGMAEWLLAELDKPPALVEA